MLKNKIFTDKSQEPNQIQPHLKLSHAFSSRGTQLHSGSTLFWQTVRVTQAELTLV